MYYVGVRVFGSYLNSPTPLRKDIFIPNNAKMPFLAKQQAVRTLNIKYIPLLLRLLLPPKTDLEFYVIVYQFISFLACILYIQF